MLLTFALLCGLNPAAHADHYPPYKNMNAETHVTIEQVTIDGVDAVIQKKILASMGFIDKTPIAIDTDWPNKIKETLEAIGYFDAIVKLRSTSKKSNVQDQTHLNMDIHLGTPVRIRHSTIRIIGSDTFVLPELSLTSGNILNMHDYKQSKKTLLDTVERAGYLNAQFKEHSIIIDKKRHAADITLTVDSGKRYYFGDIHFNQTPFDSDFLHRFVGFKTGEPYHYNSIVQLQDALSASNYFQQVAINSDKNKAQQQQIPIHIELTPRPQHLYSIGAGYGTDTGLRANLGWDERYFNRHGHYITALVSGSQMQNTFLTRYVIPGADPLKSRYEISLASQSLRYPQGNNSTEQFGLNHILKHGFWQQTLGLQYQHQRSPGNRFVSNYLLPTASWQFSNTDRLLFDTRGYRVALNFRGASRAVASSSNFIQSELRGKYIVPVMTKSRILFRGDLGYTTGNALTDLPLSLRFYNGGAQTVRGFSYYALGPGRYLTTGSTELQAAIHDKWYSCFFYDTGNAGDRFPLALERSAGVGLLWVSPVGPLELTLAKVLSQSSHPKRVQFSMGSDL